MFIVGLGAVCFGIAIGWMAYRILRLRVVVPGLSEIIAILGAIGGAAVLALYRDDVLFGWYSIGLVIGFVAYFVMSLVLYGKEEAMGLRLEQAPLTSPSGAQPDSDKD